MNYFTFIFVLSLSVFLTACSKSIKPTSPEAPPTKAEAGGFGFDGTAARPQDVKYSDLSPASTATVSNDTVIIHLGSDTNRFGLRTQTANKVEGETVYIEGWGVIPPQLDQVEVKLPAPVNPASVAVIWVDPDGSQVTVPLAK
jgi:hypothetical protein